MKSALLMSESKQQPSKVTYDRLASHYDCAMRPLERFFLRALRARTLSALPESALILEIGAGTGGNFPFYPKGAHGVASELSMEMIRRAGGKTRPPKVHLVQTSAETLPFTDASFDAACATLLFCSLASPQKAFAELRRVVRPGGTVALLEHVRPRGLLGLLFDLLSVFTVWLFDDHFNRRTALEAERAGLRLIKIEKRAFGIVQIILLKV
jgi:ubiquinone/menaquinone biosynthesis C-methylase UbiE